VGRAPGIPDKYRHPAGYYYAQRTAPSPPPDIVDPSDIAASLFQGAASLIPNASGHGGGIDVGTGGGTGGDQGGMVHPLGATGQTVHGASGVVHNNNIVNNVYNGDYNHMPINYHDHTSGPGGTQGLQELQNSASRAQLAAAAPGALPP
jgi:hypothetical protein